MKILHALYQCKTGGGSLRVALDLAETARSQGYASAVITRDSPLMAKAGGECFFSGDKWQDGWKLWQRLRQQSYDLIHVHDRYCALLLRLIPATIPSVQTNHIIYHTHRRLTPFADVVVACSRDMDRHHAEFFGLPASRRVYIPNGVKPQSPSATKLQALRQEYPFAKKRLCLTVARLSEQKGHTYLLQAIAQLPEAIRQEWQFALAGSGELESDLRTEARRLGVEQDLLWLGHRTDVTEWLSLADAFVMPSLYEGLPLALLEAMAAGLPCLVTAVDGHLDVIQPRGNGLFCEPANVGSLLQGLQMLLTNSFLRQRLGQRAQEDMRQHWSFEKTWFQYESLYQRLYRSSARVTSHAISLP